MLAKFEDDISGIVKANGTAVLESRPFKGTWGCVLLIAQTTNPADWEVRVNGSVNAIGKGSRCSLGPILLEPGDKVQLLVAGANGGSNVTGHFVGSQSDIGWQELPIPPLLPNTITSVSVPPPSTLYFGGLFGVTAGVEVTKIIAVPMGAKNLLLFAGDFVTPDMFSHIKVSSVAGVGANRTYFETFAPKQPLYVIPIFPADTQLLIAITTTAANPTAGFATFISFDSLSDLQTLWHSVPAPWQGPESSAILNASFPLSGPAQIVIPGVAGQTIYLHWVTIYVDGASSAVDVRLRDGTTDVVVAYAPNTTRGIILSKDFKGKALTVGSPLNAFLANATVATFCGISADYTQK